MACQAATSFFRPKLSNSCLLIFCRAFPFATYAVFKPRFGTFVLLQFQSVFSFSTAFLAYWWIYSSYLQFVLHINFFSLPLFISLSATVAVSISWIIFTLCIIYVAGLTWFVAFNKILDLVNDKWNKSIIKYTNQNFLKAHWPRWLLGQYLLLTPFKCTTFSKDWMWSLASAQCHHSSFLRDFLFCRLHSTATLFSTFNSWIIKFFIVLCKPKFCIYNNVPQWLYFYI